VLTRLNTCRLVEMRSATGEERFRAAAAAAAAATTATAAAQGGRTAVAEPARKRSSPVALRISTSLHVFSLVNTTLLPF